MNKEKISVHWFRRDLRLEDNVALNSAIKAGNQVLPIFIFDNTILEQLPKNDARVSFIYGNLKKLNLTLSQVGSGIHVLHGNVLNEWKKITELFQIDSVFFNHDYEPAAIYRDEIVTKFLKTNGIPVHTFKDQVFFEKNEVIKPDQTPYTVFTAYKNKWLEKFESLSQLPPEKLNFSSQQFVQLKGNFPELKSLGFEKTSIAIPEYNLQSVENYDNIRDYPSIDQTTHIGHHLRFGTVSIRHLVYNAKKRNKTFLSELIWRDFFSQILFHFPYVAERSFKKKYDAIEWENNTEYFEKWCSGKTGYPIVDAGMHQLNQTGFMHNRVRMITASFLVKHLLIDWRWGEAYFAEKLLDYDLASNNGNWQWAAGCGCDAAPYFRVFSPSLQQKKFDPNLEYVKKWIPDFNPENYIKPIVEHKFARDRIIKRFKTALS